MHPKDADGMANGVDPDQTADLGLHCLPRKLRIIILCNIYVLLNIIPQHPASLPRTGHYYHTNLHMHIP